MSTVRQTPAHTPERNMKRAEKAAALAQRASWTKMHWTPFFSEMPHRISSLGSSRNPFAIIARTACNSATFAELDQSLKDSRLGDEPRQELNFSMEKPVPSTAMDEI